MSGAVFNHFSERRMVGIVEKFGETHPKLGLKHDDKVYAVNARDSGPVEQLRKGAVRTQLHDTGTEQFGEPLRPTVRNQFLHRRFKKKSDETDIRLVGSLSFHPPVFIRAPAIPSVELLCSSKQSLR